MNFPRSSAHLDHHITVLVMAITAKIMIQMPYKLRVWDYQRLTNEGITKKYGIIIDGKEGWKTYKRKGIGDEEKAEKENNKTEKNIRAKVRKRKMFDKREVSRGVKEGKTVGKEITNT